MRIVKRLARLAPFAIIMLLLDGAANAYPQFQLTTGADRCQLCHVSPGGGGLLTEYGRDEAGSSISPRGDGRLLHGLWEPPSWIGLGGDFRGALGIKDQEDRTRTLAFPMQADLYARAVFGSWSVNLIAGVRGAARDPKPEFIYRVASREHFVMYQREPGAGLYARAGRFFPVYGLRSQDHTAYVRRYLGQHTLEEPYTLAAGYQGESSELHVALFVPQPVPLLGSGPSASGASVYYERRIADDKAAWGVQSKLAITSEDVRATIGGVGKLWVESAGLSFLAELDLQRQSFEIGAARLQVASYLGATKMLLPGWMVTAAVQHWEPDLLLRSSTRGAAELNLQYFPLAHIELHLLGRLEAVGNDFDHPGLLGLLQLHYYL
jgi:hypothetical protein